MAELNLFGISQFGKSHNVTSQDRLNCYLEVQPGDDRARVAIYGTPGLDLFTSFGDTPIRGVYQRGDFLYAVHRGTFYEVNNAGVKTAKGTLGTTSGKVYMSDNGTQLMLTDGVTGYIYFFDSYSAVGITSITNVTTTATMTTSSPHGLPNGAYILVAGATPAAYNGYFQITVTGDSTLTYTMLSNPGGAAAPVGAYTIPQFVTITDTDYPGAQTIAWQDGYFIVNPPDEQTFYVSAIGDGLQWDALDFASAEANPDNIIAVWTDNSTLYLFGSVSTEFWTNSGAADFPFSRISGGSTEWGCAAINSIVKYDNTLAFLAKNRMGEVIVAKMAGNQPQRISNPELEFIINNYTSVGDCTTIAYMLGGHPMLQVNFPSADASWLYDGLSNVWSRVQSKDIGRHRAEMGVNYLDKIIVTDFENGNLYRLNPLSYTDNGEEIAFEITTRHVEDDDRRIVIDKLQLDMETGVGLVSGQGENPQVMMSISKDGGHTYGTEQWCDMGNIGEFRQRAIWRRLGQSRDWVFKWRITDPVKRVILGASINYRVNGT
jgi:hypothetical protein